MLGATLTLALSHPMGEGIGSDLLISAGTGAIGLRLLALQLVSHSVQFLLRQTQGFGVITQNALSRLFNAAFELFGGGAGALASLGCFWKKVLAEHLGGQVQQFGALRLRRVFKPFIEAARQAATIEQLFLELAEVFGGVLAERTHGLV